MFFFLKSVTANKYRFYNSQTSVKKILLHFTKKRGMIKRGAKIIAAATSFAWRHSTTANHVWSRTNKCVLDHHTDRHLSLY